MLEFLGICCSHELRAAVAAACRRAEAGATEAEVLAFLRIRFE